MVIELRNRVCKYIIGGADYNLDVDLDKEIRKYFTVKADGYQFSPAYKRRVWDGNIKYINKLCEFSTGFLEITINLVEGFGAVVEVIDLRTNPIIIRPILDIGVGNKEGFVLRDYQQEVLNKTLSKEVGGHPFIRGLWFLAPNSGKTSTMVGFLKNIENLNALVVIDRKLNYIQTRDFLSEMFEVGEVNGSRCDLSKAVTIAMAKTLANRLEKDIDLCHDLLNKNVIICDEAHRSTSDTYKKIWSRSDCYSPILMSGTLLDIKSGTKKLNIVGNAGNLIAKVTNQDIIKLGVSLPPKIEVHLNNDGLEYAHLDHATIYQKAVVESKVRVDQIIYEFNKNPNQIMLVCVRYKEHGELVYKGLEKEFRGTVRVEFAHGGDKHKEYKIEELTNGEISIFVTTSILQESINIPCITTLFYVQGGRSKVAMKQFYGRVARIYKSMKDVSVHDFWDAALPKASRERINVWKKEGFDLKINYKHNQQYTPNSLQI